MEDKYASLDIPSDDRLWALFAYIFAPWISLIIMIFLEDKKDRPFIKYHYMQSLIWGVIWILLSFLAIGVCLFPLYIVGSIYFGVKAYQGEYVNIPILTDFSYKQGWLG